MGGETCPPSGLFKQVNSFLVPPFSQTPFFNQTSPCTHFRSNKAHDLCPAWMEPWKEPPSPGIVLLATPSDWHSPPTHARLCPSAIHSDFVQLVNLASPPCWELRQRKREEKEEGEAEEEEGWGWDSAKEWEGNQKFVKFFFSSFFLTEREEQLPDKVGIWLTLHSWRRILLHFLSVLHSLWMCLVSPHSSHMRLNLQ